MAVEWTRHRFSGGVLALDAANTVVHRLKPALRFDRFDNAVEIARFAAAAGGMCAEEPGALDGAADAAVVIELREAIDALFRRGASGAGFDPPSGPSGHLSLDRRGRASANSERYDHCSPPFFVAAMPIQASPSTPGRRRGGPKGRSGGDSAFDNPNLPRFLRAAAAALDAGSARSVPPGAVPFEFALATSALALLDPSLQSRVRVCVNCGWLFLDRSRNASRIWCDMAVCGNRAKAKRHYRRSRSEPASAEEPHAS